jgi:serine/threonine protein kinase
MSARIKYPFTTWLAICVVILVFIAHFFYEMVFKKKKSSSRFVIDGPVLGKGTFGTVTTSIYQNQIVAIKRFFVRNSVEFQNEVSMLYLLSGHPNVVQMLDHYVDTSGGLNIVFEQLDQSLLQRGRVNPQLRNSITRQILNALVFLQSKGVIHGDLKPENILFKNASEVKLIDLGTAFFERNNNMLSFCTRSYRAPEVFFETCKYTFAVDMFSLGCIVCEMEMGKPLFDSGDFDDDFPDEEILLLQLCEMEKLCGYFPRDLISGSTAFVKKFFSGGRLISKSLRSDYQSVLKKKPYIEDVFRDQRFARLVKRMISMDPFLRPTPQQALCEF